MNVFKTEKVYHRLEAPVPDIKKQIRFLSFSTNQRNPRKRTVANPTAPQEKSLKSPSTSSTLKAASKLKKKSRVETLCEKKASQRKL